MTYGTSWLNLVRACFLAAGILLTGLVEASRACSCVYPQSACEGYWPANAVFDGTVTKIESIVREEQVAGRTLPSTMHLVTLEVKQSWKGVDGPVVQVVTSTDGASCGFDFKTGRRYLVFSSGYGDDGRLLVSLCSLTREFDGTGASADFLASLDQPDAGGRVFGSIQRTARSFSPEGAHNDRVPAELDVRLSGAGGTQAMTSRGGRYQFTNLAPGRYAVEISPPEGHTAWRTWAPVEIVNRRACAEADFSVTPAGRIGGRVVDAAGRGIPRLNVEATAADVDLDRVQFIPAVTDQSDAEGYFEFENLPPGDYIVGTNLADLPSDTGPTRGQSTREAANAQSSGSVSDSRWSSGRGISHRQSRSSRLRVSRRGWMARRPARCMSLCGTSRPTPASGYGVQVVE